MAILFRIGGLAAIFGVFLRLKNQEGYSPAKRLPLLQVLWQHRSSLLSIIIASGFPMRLMLFPASS